MKKISNLIYFIGNEKINPDIQSCLLQKKVILNYGFFFKKKCIKFNLTFQNSFLLENRFGRYELFITRR